MPSEIRGYKITYRYYIDNPVKRTHLVMAYSAEDALFQFAIGPVANVELNKKANIQFIVLTVEPADGAEANDLISSGLHGRFISPT